MAAEPAMAIMTHGNQAIHVGGLQAGHDSGTMVAYGTGPMPGATMVVNADASSSRQGTLGPSVTFVTAGGEAGVQGGSDYQAAVQAASQGADGSVMHSHRLLCVSMVCQKTGEVTCIFACYGSLLCRDSRAGHILLHMALSVAVTHLCLSSIGRCEGSVSQPTTAPAADSCRRYMAAVQAAAAEAARDAGSKKGSGHESRPPSMQKAPPPAAREREKLLERLRGVCEGGSVIPVPFLPAAHAVPSALLDDLRAPYLLQPHPNPAQTYALLVSQLSCWWTLVPPHTHHP